MAITKDSFMRVYVDDEGKHNIETPKGEKVNCVQLVQVDQDASEAQKGIATVTITFIANMRCQK